MRSYAPYCYRHLRYYNPTLQVWHTRPILSESVTVSWARSLFGTVPGFFFLTTVLSDLQVSHSPSVDHCYLPVGFALLWQVEPYPVSFNLDTMDPAKLLGPAAPPPNNHTLPNFIDPPNGNTASFTVIIICLVISTFFLALRLYSRVIAAWQLRAEDGECTSHEMGTARTMVINDFV